MKLLFFFFIPLCSGLLIGRVLECPGQCRSASGESCHFVIVEHAEEPLQPCLCVTDQEMEERRTEQGEPCLGTGSADVIQG